jgi:thioredoxin 1
MEHREMSFGDDRERAGGKVKTKLIAIGAAVFVVLAGVVLLYFFLPAGSGGEALASVNGEKILVNQFLQEVEKLEEPTRGMIREEPGQYLDMMIMKTLVLQEARKEGIQPGKDGKDEQEKIEEFLQKKFSAPPAVSKEEIEEFYRLYKAGLAGKTLEEVAPMIEQALQQQKQEEAYVHYLQGIREKAAVDINQERLKAIAVKPVEAPTNTAEELAQALKSGRPVLVDFGSNTCVPCRQLRPILQEVKKEQEGKLEVLVIDIYKYQNLSNEYRIQVIPTLVFFDSSGKETFREQGYMPKAALMEHVKKIGVS